MSSPLTQIIQRVIGRAPATALGLYPGEHVSKNNKLAQSYIFGLDRRIGINNILIRAQLTDATTPPGDVVAQ